MQRIYKRSPSRVQTYILEAASGRGSNCLHEQLQWTQHHCASRVLLPLRASTKKTRHSVIKVTQMFLMALFQAKSRIWACSWLLLFRCVIASSLIYSSYPRLVFSLKIQAEFGLRLLCVAIKKAVKTWLLLIPELKFRLFCCLWNSWGCLDVSGQVFPILNLFVWKRAQIRELSLSQASLVLLRRLKFWLKRTDFWEIEAQSPSPSL